MKTKACTTPLFKDGAQPVIDDLVQKLFSEIDAAAGAALKTYAGVFHHSPQSAQDLTRVLGHAIEAALPRVIDKRFLASISSSLKGELPCNSTGFRRNLGNAGLRPIEHDILYMILYGFKHGLRDIDIAAVPIRSVTFAFGLDEALTRVNLTRARLDFKSPSAERAYLATTSTVGTIERTGGAAENKGSDFIAILTFLATLPWEKIFECLKSLFELIADALASGDEDSIEEALEETEDAIEEVDEALDDVAEDIEELEDEIREEPDADDKKELRDDLDDLKEKQDQLKKAKKALTDAQDALKDAQKNWQLIAAKERAPGFGRQASGIVRSPKSGRPEPGARSPK